MEKVIDTGAARRAVTAAGWRPDPEDRSAAGREAQMAYERWRLGGGQAAYVAYLAAADRADSARAALASPDADAA